MSNRIESLDALRGIAALQVVLAHSFVALESLSWLGASNPNLVPYDFITHVAYSPIRFLWSDSQAVKVFFVLSGFVLSLPYFSDGRTSPSYTKFLIKRVLRLYLPCVAILAVSIFFQKLFYRSVKLDGFGEWPQIMWSVPLTTETLRNIMLLNSKYLDYFNRSLWTLGPEIKLSLIIPLYVLIIRHLNIFCSVISVVIYICCYHLLVKFGFHLFWPDFSTLYFFSFFIIGAVICKYRFMALIFINKMSNVSYYFFIILVMYIYTYKFSFWWIASPYIQKMNVISEYISAIAAALLLLITISTRAEKVLNIRFFQFLGKISFSIYLIHIVIITLFAFLLQSYFDPEIIVLFAFISSFPFAWIFYMLVELPSLHFANRMSDAYFNLKSSGNCRISKS